MNSPSSDRAARPRRAAAFVWASARASAQACVLACALACVPGGTGARAESAPALAARAWVLVDATSGVQLAAHEAVQRLEPASLVKLMTAYVVFTALGEKRIGLNDAVIVSRAAFAAPGRGGSRMFIEPNRPVSVAELLAGLLVVSGSDAAVALAEHTAGSVKTFVERMNSEAQRLMMVNTRFTNPTGLSDPQQYSTAIDLARLAQRLQSDFPQHAELFRMREFTHNRITQPNRNQLLWSDATVDGMKTGHLEAAGWSIVATASRARGTPSAGFQRRLVAVVLGAPSAALRAQDALRLLNYGFTEFETLRLHRRGEVLLRPRVWKGDRTEVPIGPDRDVYVTLPSAELRRLGSDGLKSALERPDPLLAPLRQGETVGRLKISAGGRTYADVPIVALERVGEAGLIGRAYDSIQLWRRKTP